MPYTQVYVHFVWTTKHKIPFLNTQTLREKLWNHISENAVKKGIFIDRINGFQDHCHCLISLGVEQSMSKVMQLVKGESSHWMNKYQVCQYKFEWQDEYFAASVSHSALDKVRAYIDNQEAHHRKNTCQNEYEELMSE